MILITTLYFLVGYFTGNKNLSVKIFSFFNNILAKPNFIKVLKITLKDLKIVFYDLLYKGFMHIGYYWALIAVIICLILNIIFPRYENIDYIWISPFIIIFTCMIYETFHYDAVKEQRDEHKLKLEENDEK